jgi:hypothetical protein
VPPYVVSQLKKQADHSIAKHTEDDGYEDFIHDLLVVGIH